MANGEFFEDQYPVTSQPDMDPKVKRAICDDAEAGHDLDALIEKYGWENVRLAATNNSTLLDLIVFESGGSDAA